MNMTDIILTKRYGNELSDEQIRFWIKGVTDGSIPDYQISSLLMAIVLNGMSDRETATLTMEMANSGHVNDLSYIKGIPVDKHSTGGVGDKVTPLLLPLLATYGVDTVKLSGRGLGFTGGTVDKFESIEGFNVEVPSERFPELISKTGMVISGQTPDLAPADKVLYSLRDVTGTVDSIPLIASSIMSKKIAGGAKAIVLDVTCGYGAFMKDKESAVKLSEAMIRIGKLAGIKTVAVVTDMSQPLGRCIGNTLEMMEVYETLTGKGAADVEEVVATLAVWCIKLAEKAGGMSDEELYKDCIDRLKNGQALEKYYELLISQGGKFKDNSSPSYVEYPHEAIRVTAPESGYVTEIKADIIGKASVALGAGRQKKGDKIDYGAGICLYVKVGSKVKRGDVICSLCHGGGVVPDEGKLFDVMESVYEAFRFSDVPPESKGSCVLQVIS